MKGFPFGEYLAVLLVFILKSVSLNSLNSSGFALWCISKHGEYFPHPEDCAKFLRCSHGRALVFQCPANLQWNQDLKTCYYPQITGQCGTGEKTIFKEAVKTSNNQENLMDVNETIFIQKNEGNSSPNSELSKVRSKRNCAQDAKLMTSKENLKEHAVGKPIFESVMNKLDLSETENDFQPNVDNEILRKAGETSNLAVSSTEPFSDSEELNLKIENIADKNQMSLTKEITKIETINENLDSEDSEIKTNQQSTVTNSNNLNKPEPQTSTNNRNESTTTDRLKEILKTKINPSDFEKISEGNLALESLLTLIENEYYDHNSTIEDDLTIEDYDELPIPEQNILLTEKNEVLAPNIVDSNSLNTLENNESRNLATHQNNLIKSTINYNPDDSDKLVIEDSKELPITTNKSAINYNPDDSDKLVIEDPKELPITTKSLLNNNADEREEDFYESVAEPLEMLDKIAAVNFPVQSDDLTKDLFTEDIVFLQQDATTKKADVYETTTDYSTDKTTNYDHLIREDPTELPIMTDNISLTKKDDTAQNTDVHDSTDYNTKETTDSAILIIGEHKTELLTSIPQSTDLVSNSKTGPILKETSMIITADVNDIEDITTNSPTLKEGNSTELTTSRTESTELITNVEFGNTAKQKPTISKKYNDINTDSSTNEEKGIVSDSPTSTIASTDLDEITERISFTTQADVEDKTTNSFSENISMTNAADAEENAINSPTLLEDNSSGLSTSTDASTEQITNAKIANTVTQIFEEKATNSRTLLEDNSSELPTSTYESTELITYAEIVKTVTQILGISKKYDDIPTDIIANEENGIVSELPTSTMAFTDLDVISEKISMTNENDIEEKPTYSSIFLEDNISEFPTSTDTSTELITNAEIGKTVTQIIGISKKYDAIPTDTTTNEEEEIVSELPTSTMAFTDLDVISERISMINEADVVEKATNSPTLLEDNNSELPASTDTSTELITNAEIGKTVTQIIGISKKYDDIPTDITANEEKGIVSELPTSTMAFTDLDVISERISMTNENDIEEKATYSSIFLEDNSSELPTSTDTSTELITNAEIGKTVTQIIGISKKYDDIPTDITANEEKGIVSELPTSTMAFTDLDVISERISMTYEAGVEEKATYSLTLLEDNSSESPKSTYASTELITNAEIANTVTQILRISKKYNGISTDTTTNEDEEIISELSTSTIASTDLDLISERISMTYEAGVEEKATNSRTLLEDNSSESPKSTYTSTELITNAEISNTVTQILGISKKYNGISTDTTTNEDEEIVSELPTSATASTDLVVVSERSSVTYETDVEEKATNSPIFLEDNSSELPTSTYASTELITNAEIGKTVTQIIGISKKYDDIPTDITANEEKGIVSELPTSTMAFTDLDVISERISMTNESDVVEKATNSPTLLEDNNSELPTFTEASAELIANTEIGNTVTQILGISKKYGHITADTTTNEEDEIVLELPTSTMASTEFNVFSQKISITNEADVEENAINTANLLEDNSSELPTTTYASTELTTNAEIGTTVTQIPRISIQYNDITSGNKVNEEEGIVSEFSTITSTDIAVVSENVSMTEEADTSVKRPSLNQNETVIEIIKNTTQKFSIETTESTIHDSLNSGSYSKPPPNILDTNSSKNSISDSIEPIGASLKTSNIAATTTPFAWGNIFPDPEATPDPRLPFLSPLCQGENNRRQFQALKCSQYYQCFAGWAFLLNCRDGNFFNGIQGSCIEDSKMECKE